MVSPVALYLIIYIEFEIFGIGGNTVLLTPLNLFMVFFEQSLK